MRTNLAHLAWKYGRLFGIALAVPLHTTKHTHTRTQQLPQARCDIKKRPIKATFPSAISVPSSSIICVNYSLHRFAAEFALQYFTYYCTRTAKLAHTNMPTLTQAHTHAQICRHTNPGDEQRSIDGTNSLHAPSRSTRNTLELLLHCPAFLHRRRSV